MSTLRARHRSLLAAGAGLAVLGGGLVLAAAPASAATIDVTTTVDGAPGSLRDAITQANASVGPDIINVPAGTYTLTLAGAGEDNNATGDLDIKDDVTIVGLGGAGSTIIDANGIDRAFHVQSNSATFQGLTVRNGTPPSGEIGGAIRINQGKTVTVLDSVFDTNHGLYGGAIYADRGSVTVMRSTFTGNQAISIPGNGSVGGAISMSGGTLGTLVVADSLFTGNQAINGNAGAIYAGSTATITNTTITGNTAGRAAVLVGQSGQTFHTATFLFTTISGNTNTGNAGAAGVHVQGIQAGGPTASFTGTLLLDNISNGVGANCATQVNGTITSGGSNLSDDATCTAFTQPGDLSNNSGTTVAALADNGGPTQTLALMAGSSAIDAAACAGGVSTDQRGFPRPAGTGCDIGAYEADAQAPTTTTTSTSTSTTSTSTTSTTSTTMPASTTTTADPTTGGANLNPTSTTSTIRATSVVVYSGTLPVTGSQSTPLVIAGSVLVAAGLALTAESRRRRIRA